MERIILARLTKHLEDNQILSKSQSGFRARRSTKDNLVYLVQKVKESFNRKRKTMVIFFDIEAAFDKVWHNGLIFKLISIKVPYYILQFIINFLKDRSLVVKVNNVLSERIPITCGVPQGACLSPTLFSIFINDCPARSVRNEEQTMLFVDDLVFLVMYRLFDSFSLSD